MNDLLNLIDVMKLLKYEHELTLSITEQEIELSNIHCIDNEILRIKHSLDKVCLGLDDAYLLALIKSLLKFDQNEDFSTKQDLFLLHYNCTKMKTELLHLLNRYHDNQNKIKLLELENLKLKEDINLNGIVRKNILVNSNQSGRFSPTSITSSFKFDKRLETNKKERQKLVRMKVPDQMRTLYDLVMQYTVRGNYNVAIPLCQQALADIEKSKGKGCHEYATILHVMANVYRDIGNYQKSIEGMLEALSIRENLTDLPKSEILKTLNCLSVLYGLLFNWVESAKYCLKCIDLIKKVYGEFDIRLAKELENMATIFKNDKKIENSIEYFEKSYKICEYNHQFLDSLRLQRNMADCHLYLQNYDLALDLYKDIYRVSHQSAISAIWGVNKPLWQIAEENEIYDSPELDKMEFNWVAWRNEDKLDERDLRDILIKMAGIYGRLNMKKAAKYLKGWPDFNILSPNQFGRLYKSSSLVQLKDETIIQDKTNRNSAWMGTRQRRFSDNFRDKLPVKKRKQQDNDITIYESWTKYFLGSSLSRHHEI